MDQPLSTLLYILADMTLLHWYQPYKNGTCIVARTEKDARRRISCSGRRVLGLIARNFILEQITAQEKKLSCRLCDYHGPTKKIPSAKSSCRHQDNTRHAHVSGSTNGFGELRKDPRAVGKSLVERASAGATGTCVRLAVFFRKKCPH